MQTHQMQIELDGLITLLAQNLYADPDVFLREMIQNAHDAIVRRRAQDSELLPEPQIHLHTDEAAQTLTITDNGAGLKLEEIHCYLATIGRSGTRELKEALAAQDPMRAHELIGQFGIGLLSAFIVAERIELTTRAAADCGYRWVSGGGKDYRVEPCRRDEVGTTAVLHLSQQHLRYLEEAHVRKIVRTYADLIGVPIYLNGGPQPINQVDPPWLQIYPSWEERFDALRQFVERRFPHERLLYMWPVERRFNYRDERGERCEGEVRGVLAISDFKALGTERAGSMDLFISQMFIAGKHPGLLPDWARFVRGVIECNQLTPNAARDNVMIDAALKALRAELGQEVMAELGALHEVEEELFGRIMQRHALQILALCTEDEHQVFFEQVADMVPLATSAGEQTLGEYLSDGSDGEAGQRRTVYYVQREHSKHQYELLGQERDMVVVDASYAYVEAFLRRYESTWPQRLRLQRLDGEDAGGLFAAVDDEGELRGCQALVEALEQIPGVTARLSRFKPASVPALLAQDEAEDERQRLQAVAELGGVSASMREQVRQFLEAQTTSTVLHLNADCPLLQRLAARGFYTDPVGKEAVYALYNNARMLRGHALKTDDLRDMFARYNELLKLILDSVDTT